MRRLTGKSLLSLILVLSLLGFLVLLDEANAQRGGRGGGGGHGGGRAYVSGGGGYRGGGMGGGGFQGVQRSPGAGGAYYGGSYQRNVNVNVDNNWHRGRYGYGAVAAGVAAGTVVWAISSSARPVVYGGTTYYVDGNTYYKPCYQGDELAYCVVENPNP